MHLLPPFLVNALSSGFPDNLISYMSSITELLVLQQVKRKRTILPKTHFHGIPASRIVHEIILLKLKCINGLTAWYLVNLLSYYRLSRHLRSSSHDLLNERSIRTKFRDREFDACAPRLWDKLTATLVIFRTYTFFNNETKISVFSIQ